MGNIISPILGFTLHFWVTPVFSSDGFYYGKKYYSIKYSFYPNIANLNLLMPSLVFLFYFTWSLKIFFPIIILVALDQTFGHLCFDRYVFISSVDPPFSLGRRHRKPMKRLFHWAKTHVGIFWSKILLMPCLIDLHEKMLLTMHGDHLSRNIRQFDMKSNTCETWTRNNYVLPCLDTDT